MVSCRASPAMPTTCRCRFRPAPRPRFTHVMCSPARRPSSPSAPPSRTWVTRSPIRTALPSLWPATTARRGCWGSGWERRCVREGGGRRSRTVEDGRGVLPRPSWTVLYRLRDLHFRHHPLDEAELGREAGQLRQRAEQLPLAVAHAAALRALREVQLPRGGKQPLSP